MKGASIVDVGRISQNNIMPGTIPKPVKKEEPKSPGDTFVKGGAGENKAELNSMTDLVKKTMTEGLLKGKGMKDVKALQELNDIENALWSYEYKDGSSLPVLYDRKNKRIYAGEGKWGKTVPIAVNNKGELLWKSVKAQEGGPSIIASPFYGETEVDNYSFVSTEPLLMKDGTLVTRSPVSIEAFKPDGTSAWSFKAVGDDNWNSRPLEGPDGTVLVTMANPNFISEKSSEEFANKQMVVLALKDGEPKWSFYKNKSYPSDYQNGITDDGTMFVRDNGKVGFFKRERKDYLVGLSPEGKEVCKIEIPEEMFEAEPFVSRGPENTVLVSHGAKSFAAYDTSGNKKWEFKMKCHGLVRLPPTVDDEGNVYVPPFTGEKDINSELTALDKNGNVKWTTPMNNGIITPVTIGPNGKLYMGDYEGFVHIVSPDGKEEKQIFAGKMGKSAIAIGDDGEILVNTKNRLVALSDDPEKVKKATETQTQEKSEGIKVEEEFVEIGGVVLERKKKA